MAKTSDKQRVRDAKQAVQDELRAWHDSRVAKAVGTVTRNPDEDLKQYGILAEELIGYAKSRLERVAIAHFDEGVRDSRAVTEDVQNFFRELVEVQRAPQGLLKARGRGATANDARRLHFENARIQQIIARECATIPGLVQDALKGYRSNPQNTRSAVLERRWLQDTRPGVVVKWLWRLIVSLGALFAVFKQLHDFFVKK